MKLNLRTRMLMAAVLPALLVATILAGATALYAIDELEKELHIRGVAISRQVAVAAEYGSFSGQREILSAVTASALKIDPDILGVAVLDAQGAMMAHSGYLHPSVSSGSAVGQGSHVERDVLVFVEPVILFSQPVDDIYSGTASSGAIGSRVIGHVAVEMSRSKVFEKTRAFLVTAFTVGLLAVVVGSWFALRIAQSVTTPLLEAQEVVARITNGDLTVRMNVQSSGALQFLAAGINDMVGRISVTHEELQARVADITRELRREKEAAEQATIAKTNFLSAASHDLRQPLHALGLFVSGLSLSAVAKQEPKLLGHIQESVDILQDLLNSILDVSRLEHGDQVPEIRNFAMADVMDRLARSLSVQAEGKGLKALVRPTQVWVRSDPKIVERILLNLVGNALRYTPAGGILVACRRRRDAVRVEVWDTGDGIPEHAREKIFEDYVQLGNPERDRGKGMGLGLAICRRLAALLGVRIGVRSRQGRGSVFWFELPVVQPGVIESEPSGKISPIEQATDIALLSGTVLVVDGNALIRTGFEQTIASWGVNVMLAADSKEALQCCRQGDHLPDLTICNMRLSGRVSGIELAQKLQREFEHMSFLLVSADITEEDHAVARRAGFVSLRMPVSPGRLRAAVQQLLSSVKSAPIVQ